MSSDISTEQVVDRTDVGREMWSDRSARPRSTTASSTCWSKGPRDTGPEGRRATWALNGTLQVTTKDNTEGDS